MNGKVFFKSVIISVVCFALAAICYHFSPDFLNHWESQSSWIESLVKLDSSSGKSILFDNANAIVIMNTNANIHIRPDHKDNNQIKMIANLLPSDSATVDNNHTLNIKIQNPTSESVILRIPSSVQKIQIHSKSGDIYIKNIQLNNLNIENISGNLKIKNVSIVDTEIKSISGDIVWKGLSKTMHVKTVSGNIDVESGEHAPEYNMESVSGEINLNLLNPVNSTLDAKSASGNVITKHTTTVTSLGLIKLRSVSGNITVTGK